MTNRRKISKEKELFNRIKNNFSQPPLKKKLKNNPAIYMQVKPVVDKVQ